MWQFKEECPRCFCRLLVALLAVVAAGRPEEVTDFIAVNTLPDGEVETRIFYRGVSAKETMARGSSDIKFRQVATPKHLIQLIYSDGEDLKDCEIVHKPGQVKKFLSTFKSDLRNLIATSNLTVESLDDRPLPSEIASWLNYTQLRDSCRQIHQQLKKQVREMKKHDRFEGSEEINRQKRSIFILPGTLWCGDKTNARRYTELGGMSKTDRCCRKHDHCKRNIPPFTTKFHYHNYSPFTLSHCHCDLSFRACLKMVDTSDSNLVGKLFFNVVQSKCFVIKPQKVCVKTSWWGQCEKYRHEKRAILRDNLPY